jgi:hypothetical protein
VIVRQACRLWRTRGWGNGGWNSEMNNYCARISTAGRPCSATAGLLYSHPHASCSMNTVDIRHHVLPLSWYNHKGINIIKPRTSYGMGHQFSIRCPDGDSVDNQKITLGNDKIRQACMTLRKLLLPCIYIVQNNIMTASCPLQVKLGSFRTCHSSFVAKIMWFLSALKPIVLEQLDRFW